MRIEIQAITPAIAAEYLKKNTRNRNLQQVVVDRYADDMARGNWQLTHQGIAFNADGVLLDGQHRLAAVIKAGVTVEMMVAFGVADKAQGDMDSQQVRKVSHSLTIAYGTSVSDRDVAVAKMIFCVEQGRVIKPSNSQTYDLIKQLRPSLDWAYPYRAVDGKGVRSAPVWSAICLAYFYENDLSRLADFCETLVGHRMANGAEDRSAQLLREMLISSKGLLHNHASRLEVFLKTQRATYAFCRRESLSKIYATKQYYVWPLNGSQARS